MHITFTKDTDYIYVVLEPGVTVYWTVNWVERDMTPAEHVEDLIRVLRWASRGLWP